MDYPDESLKDLPLVLLLIDNGKGNWTCGETVNLSSNSEEARSPQRKIIRGIHSSQLGIQPSQFFLQEIDRVSANHSHKS
jgi:hypothetical protein